MTDTQYIIEQLMKGRVITGLDIYQETGNMKATTRMSDVRALGYVVNDKFATATSMSGRTSTFKKYWMTPDNIKAQNAA